MKRAILIDGNNLLFRSYYATAYNGNLMKNSKDFPTNALFGFVNMINKIMSIEKPEYIMVAFDKGKNFRHEKYTEYKAGRIETPNDLKIQFPLAYDILDAMGITSVAIDNYEADDIIGTFAKMADIDDLYDATIVSSDKDLLQLISHDVNVKLLKQKDYILMDEKVFFDTYGLKPIRMIDIKALMGDASDNIPGVKGIGEKTALNLLHEYDTIENLYDNIDSVKGKTKEKLIEGKDSAFFSKDIATIYKDVPLNMTFNDIKLKDRNLTKLKNIYKDLEFFSMLEKVIEVFNNPRKEVSYILVNDKLNISKPFSFYLEVSNENYHTAKFVGLSIYDGENTYILSEDAVIMNKDIFSYADSTYDLKKSICFLRRYGIVLNNCKFDNMIATYLLNYNVKDDISYIANTCGYDIPFYDSIVKNDSVIVSNEQLYSILSSKSKYIYETKSKYINELVNEEMINLFNDIEMPLVSVLASMEINGIRASSEAIDELHDSLEKRLSDLTKEIYGYAGCEFNIQSAKQMGEVLFEKLDLPHGKKKGKNGYSTDHDTLIKYYDMHPIIKCILEYRNLYKLMSGYTDKLKSYILEDGKIHTIYKQAITRTGRLSSVLPNLQNIPIRSEEGRKIREAFIPEEDSVILDCDYSQIELRLMAHISKDENMINAFNTGEDIHTKVASDVFDVPINEVTKEQRRTAKAVIFGIVYGISGFGLGENLHLAPKEAKIYIDKYLMMYPKVKEYMDNIVSFAKEHGYVRTLFGRKRVIDELKNTNYIIRKSGERIALNTPLQGTGADIIKKAMIEIDKELTRRNLNSKMLVQVHDELVFSVPKNELEVTKELVTNIMENTYTLLVPLKVESDIGDNWYDAK